MGKQPTWKLIFTTVRERERERAPLIHPTFKTWSPISLWPIHLKWFGLDKFELGVHQDAIHPMESIPCYLCTNLSSTGHLRRINYKPIERGSSFYVTWMQGTVLCVNSLSPTKSWREWVHCIQAYLSLIQHRKPSNIIQPRNYMLVDLTPKLASSTPNQHTRGH